jgi:aldose 1-epimerase
MSTGGQEVSIRAGAYHGVVTEVGGGLRLLRHGATDLVRPYAEDEVRPRYAGAILAPWPNRVADGVYMFDEETHQLPLTEPERGNALHGLVTWDRFDVVDRSGSSVTLRDRLVPRTGYPFELEITVAYTLHGHEGLRTAVTARNTGVRPAPWGTAAHPYLQAGTDHVDECLLTVPAAEVLEVTPDRLLPVRTAPVEESGLDFRVDRKIGETFVDHAFTALAPDDDGLTRVRLRSPDGGGVECSWDPAVLPWVQVHTADTPDVATNRTGLAVEPMTCAPDAFNSSRDLVVLGPGEEHTASWSLRSLSPD